MKILTFTLCCLIAITATFSGCKPMPNDGVPFYLRIDSAIVVAGDTIGTNTSKITDVWAEANADNLGAYELPINFPVLQQNDVRMVLSAGIWGSGQQGYRVNYPFYTTDTFTINNAEPGQQYSHIAKFEYIKGTVFTFTEDFKFGNIFDGLTLEYDSSTNHQTCGTVSVDAVDSNKEAHTINFYDLPEGQEIWLELDYKAEVPFYVGFYGKFGTEVSQYPVLFLNTKATWNKVYIKLSEAVGSTRADTYSIYVEALRPFGSSGGKVYIDNIKLVHL
jgi:hypothetical protein